MGKPGQSSDRSCSGALSRRIAHRVSMHVPLHNGVHFDAVVPKMAKQTLAFPASLRTRFLNWKEAPAAYYNHPNNPPGRRCASAPINKCHENFCMPFCNGKAGPDNNQNQCRGCGTGSGNCEGGGPCYTRDGAKMGCACFALPPCTLIDCYGKNPPPRCLLCDTNPKTAGRHTCRAFTLCNL